MNDQKLSFFALLANVDDSILNLKMKNGFEIKSLTLDEGSKIISAAVRIPVANINHWSHYSTAFSQRKIYYVDYDINSNSYHNDQENHSSYEMDLYNSIYDSVTKNLNDFLQLLHLFKEGNIYSPFWIVYSIDYYNEIDVLLAGGGSSTYHYPDIFQLPDSDIVDAQKFLDTTELPLKKEYLHLAHENFEESYSVLNHSLSFLSLMIASEILFNPGSGEISYRISRNFAVLLGTSVEDARIVQKKIKELYRKRSELVHRGKDVIHFVGEEDYVKTLRHYVRESLKKIILLNLPKDELMDLLNSKGFGEPLIIEKLSLREKKFHYS
jgi:hypothetical protein